MVGNNIRALRKFYGQTQQQLAEQMGITKDWVSKWENNKRAISIENLSWLAEYYRVSLEELINGDFSFLNDAGSNWKFKGFCNVLKFEFPTIKSETALKNHNFKMGYVNSVKIMEKLQAGQEPKFEWIERAIDYYWNAWREENCKEAAANCISLLLLIGNACVQRVNQGIENRIRKNLPISSKNIKQALLVDPKKDWKLIQELEETRRDFLKEYRKELEEAIKFLKQDQQLAELGDFFIAVRYICGLNSISLRLDTSMEIGYELLNTYARLGNKYARRLIAAQHRADGSGKVA